MSTGAVDLGVDACGDKNALTGRAAALPAVNVGELRLSLAASQLLLQLQKRGGW